LSAAEQIFASTATLWPRKPASAIVFSERSSGLV
jgi:hypothetical protein